MNIMISGYTAAGKTTHARLLADALGYEIVWAARLLLERLGVDLSRTSESEVWFHHYAEIAERRRLTTVDAEIDRYLADRLKDSDRTIFDARFLPWVTSAPGLRIWLASDLPSRARKCRVSLGDLAPEIWDCAVHVHSKDGVDVARLAQDLHAIFGPDDALFDVVLDNSVMMPEASTACAQDGIARFHRYLCAVVSAVDGNDRDLRALYEADPAEFVRVVRFVRGTSVVTGRPADRPGG